MSTSQSVSPPGGYRSDPEVLVIGYGPVGAVLAALLGQRGLRVSVVERERDLFPLPRAIAFDDEVLRTLVRLPGLENLLHEVNRWQRVSFLGPDRRILTEIEFGETELGMPAGAFFHQPTFERQLRAGVDTLPTVEVVLGRTVVEVHDGEDGVTALLDDGTAVRAKWGVACDGAGSTVRAQLGIAYLGTSHRQPWLVVDVATDSPLRELPYFSYVCDPERPSVNMPMPGGHRWEWMLLPGEDPELMATPRMVTSLLRPWVDPDSIRVERAAVYTFHARSAARWRQGRLLLAGDAAHCMPPFAGQGLAAGIRDAVALSWRLHEVLRGLAPADLLDGYEPERRPHVATATKTALLAGRVLQSTRPGIATMMRTTLKAIDVAPGVGGWFRRGGARPRPGIRRYAASGHPGAGTVLPNPRVRTLAGLVCRLDDLLGNSWALLAEGRDPLTAGDSDAGGWARSRGVGALALVPPGGLRSVATLTCLVAEDLDGTVLRLLRRWRKRPVAAVRPDRYVHGLLAVPFSVGDLRPLRPRRRT